MITLQRLDTMVLDARERAAEVHAELEKAQAEEKRLRQIYWEASADLDTLKRAREIILRGSESGHRSSGEK